jgi:atypical dual specificity phosphatase
MKINWVEEGKIAAGGIPLGLSDLESLQSQGIEAIVTLTEHPLTTLKEITPVVLNRLGFTALHVSVVDQQPPSTSNVETVVKFLDEMESKRKAVYVHCHAGVGRTGTMLHAFYLAKGFTLEKAQAIVRKGRPASQWLMLSASQRAFLEKFSIQKY